MYVLTCPSCESEVRCRYARGGAVASCQGCRATYRLNNHTMRTEADREDLFAPWRGGSKAEASDDAPLAELKQAVTVLASRRRATGRGRRGRLAIMLGFNLAASAFVVAWVVLVLRWTSEPATATAANGEVTRTDGAPATPPAIEPAPVEVDDSAGADLPIAAEDAGITLPPVRFTR